ncbi:rhamnan synthesis F family protein [Nocardioides sp. C4-1]|uniref:rhamnan synthesis F family protein n=1 Tax=Nocardioides sp. C4-1 TaxID=3151851 RepID=UPI003262FFE0
MSRIAIMAHYDPRGQVAPHVRRHVEHLAVAFDTVVVVSTADLGPQEREWLEQRCRLIVRPNFGYDFFSYKTGLDSCADLSDHDEVVLCNDTFVGPLVSYDEIFAGMADEPVDFWGFTASDRNRPHLQSFFVCFRSWVVGSPAFTDFWRTLVPIDDRLQVIYRYEIGLTEALEAGGFRWKPYFEATASERTLARRRMAWWSIHRQKRPTGRRRTVKHLWNTARAPWNPAIGLADSALDGGRLPVVKIDTLRYDPYGLGADRLLRSCERVYASSFAGVREMLTETAPLYPTRADEQLRPTPPALRPLRRLVEYRRGW